MELSLDDHTSRCLEVLSKINNGVLQKDLAKEYGVNPPTISKWKKKAKAFLNTKDTKVAKTNGKVKETKERLPGKSSPQNPIPTPPQAPAQAPKMGHLPPFIRDVMKIQAAFSALNLPCNVKDAMALKETADQMQSTEYIPPWSRPPIMSKRQDEIIDAICYGSKQVIMIEGSKRTGKSTSVFLAICESIWNGALKRWKMWGSTQDNARDILRDIKFDPITVEYTKPLYKGTGSADRLLFFNNGHIEVKSTGSERRSSGIDADAIWIDESHSVLIENPKTFAMAVMVLLAQPNLKIIFSMNREGQAYEYFKNVILDKLDASRVDFFTLNREDVDHISQENDELVRVLVEASAGADYAAQYLDNQFVREEGLYYPTDKVRKAFAPHDTPRLERFEILAAGVDWGDTHDTAIHVGGIYDKEWFEVETVYLKHPTSTQLERIFARLFREYPGIVIVWEQSPLGGFIRNTLKKTFPNQRFINSNFTQHKEKYIDNLYVYFVKECIHLLDSKLMRQCTQYVNDKKNDDGHDALAHVLFKIAPLTSLKSEVKAVGRNISVI